MSRRKALRDIDGILILEKPVGISSNGALQQVRHLYHARKAGHCGSLDPLASGLLPICLGQATRFSGYLLGADKTYRATCRLGVTTTTGDAEGDVIATREVEVRQDQVERALTQFVGSIEQVPPMYSALKHQGQRLYKLARAGVQVERAPRQVRIHELRLLAFEGDRLSLLVRCTKGTYIRTLAEDIGSSLGCGAHLSALHRSAVEPFTEEDAVALETLRDEAQTASIDAHLLPVAAALSQFPQMLLPASHSRDICHGKKLPLSDQSAPGLYRLQAEDGRFLGLGEVSADGYLLAKRLMNTAR